MKGKLLKKYFIKKATFIKKCTAVALTACLAFPVNWGGVLHEPVKVMAEQFVPIEDLEIGLTEAVGGRRYELNRATIKNVIPQTATNQSNVKWMIFYPYGMNIEIEGNKASNVTAFTPNEEGYIWLYVEVEKGLKQTHSPWTTDGNFKKFFKVAVKNAAEGAEPNIYPAPAKDKLKPIKTPISMGWFRTWHDYWVEAAWAESSNKFGDAPEEVDIMAIFPDYTSPDNPFWEVLKNEYVPTLNARGTRVVRTIGMQDVTGKRGLSKTLAYEKNEEGYRKLAEEIVKEYVDKFNLDGLDIDFENENNPHDNAGIKQGIAVIKEIAKIIGKNSGRPNTIFMVDTDMRLGSAPEIFPEILPHVDFLARQNYRHEDESSYDSFKDYIKKDQFISGFSFYEENSNNHWGNVPSADLVADRNTNETTLQNPDELLQKQEFTNCDAYKQAKWVSEGGYGGIAAYAIDRDGVAEGNNKKFFKLSQGGKPTQYYVSRALKHFMRYNASKDVTDIEDVPTKFNAGDTLILTGTVKPDDAAKTDITWEIVEGADKTTAKEAKIEEKNKLTAKGDGKITVKASVKDGVKTGTVLKYQDFSKEFEITVNKKPVINSSGGGSQYVPVVDFIKEKLEKEKLEKEKLEKEKLEKEKLEKEKLEKEKLEKEKEEKEKEALLKKNAPVEEIIKTKNKTASVGEDVIQKVLKANNGKVKVKVKSTIVSINRDIIENLVGEEKKDIKVSVTKSGKNKLNLMKFKKKLSDKKLVSNTVLAVDIKMGSESVNDYDLNGGKVEIIVETSLKKLPKVVYVMNLNTGKIIKAKYSKKTKKIYFSTEKVGKFVLIKK